MKYIIKHWESDLFFVFFLQEADSWEIIEGLKIGQTNVQRPDKHEGFMLKKRKWPLKGWHKVTFSSYLSSDHLCKWRILFGVIRWEANFQGLILII